MTVDLQLSPDQESRLEEARSRQDAAVVREVLLQALDSTVERLIEPPQSASLSRQALLDRLADEMRDAPALSDEAASRASIYAIPRGTHPDEPN